MAGTDSTAGRSRNRLLPVLFWVGVGLAPIAALLLLVGQSNGILRVAAVLGILCVVLIGLSVVLGGNAESVRDAIEDTLHEDLDLLRGEIATATHASQQALGERLRVLQHNVDVLRGQLEAVRGAGVPGQRAPEPGPTGPRPAEQTRAAAPRPADAAPRAAARVPDVPPRAAGRTPDVPPLAAARVPDAPPRAAARVPDVPSRAAARVPDVPPRAAARVPERGPAPAEPEQGGYPAPPGPGGSFRSAERVAGGHHSGDVLQPGPVPAEGPPARQPGGRAQVPPPGPRGPMPPEPGRPRTGPFHGPAAAPVGRPTGDTEDPTGTGHRYAGVGAHYSEPEPDTGQGNWSEHAPSGTGQWDAHRDPEFTGDQYGSDQRHGRAVEPTDDPADVDYWSDLRSGGRWSTDGDDGRGGRPGAHAGAPGSDRYAALRSDDEPYEEPYPVPSGAGADRHRRPDDWPGGADTADGGREAMAGARRRYDDNEYGYPPNDEVPRAGGARRRAEPDYPEERWR
ncbi:hypothetical protein [Micromonospora zhanjiangensis]|uniref:Uncharacterized protein n=1 Tax=Micromonospora zhanjiangensis TaxID=1522057 RepID=A0ABV8KES4_9ACTN